MAITFFDSFSWLQFEPVITPHNITLVHHILVYACGNASVLPSGVDDCYGANPDFALCSQVLVGWAVGGEVSLQGPFPSPLLVTNSSALVGSLSSKTPQPCRANQTGEVSSYCPHSTTTSAASGDAGDFHVVVDTLRTCVSCYHIYVKQVSRHLLRLSF